MTFHEVYGGIYESIVDREINTLDEEELLGLDLEDFVSSLIKKHGFVTIEEDKTKTRSSKRGRLDHLGNYKIHYYIPLVKKRFTINKTNSWYSTKYLYLPRT